MNTQKADCEESHCKACRYFHKDNLDNWNWNRNGKQDKVWSKSSQKAVFMFMNTQSTKTPSYKYQGKW